MGLLLVLLLLVRYGRSGYGFCHNLQPNVCRAVGVQAVMCFSRTPSNSAALLSAAANYDAGCLSCRIFLLHVVVRVLMEACPYDVCCRSMGEIKVKRRLVSSGHSVRAAQCSAIRCVFGALLSLTCADGKDERQLRIETTTDRGHAGHTGVGKLLHGHRFNVLPCKGTKDGFEHLLRSFRRFDPVFSWFFAETVRSQNAVFYIIYNIYLIICGHFMSRRSDQQISRNLCVFRHFRYAAAMFCA